jgi:hypothetical protein
MTPLRRIALIGNSLPRRCGIATFTTDLQRAISASRPDLETCIVAMTDRGQAYDYPPAVAFQIKDDNVEDYLRAADFLNAGRFDTVCLQHEFGIFGGEAGRPYPPAAGAPDHAGRNDASYRIGQPVSQATRGHGAHRRCVVEGGGDG